MFSRGRRYGATANMHDGWKVLAILLMSIDHYGLHLGSESLWWRAWGRGAFPIFAFLAGYYATSSRLYWLLLMAMVMQVGHVLMGGAAYPLNILFSIVIGRSLLAWAERRGCFKQNPLLAWAICLLFALPTYMMFEYGTIGVMLMALGLMVREGRKGANYQVFFVVSIVSYIGLQHAIFHFSYAQLVMMGLLVTGIMGILWCKGVTPLIAGLDIARHRSIDWLCRLLGRYSLEYYVVHKLVLQAIGVALVV